MSNLSNLDAAIKAALLRGEITDAAIVNKDLSRQSSDSFILCNSEGKTLSKIPLSRVAEILETDPQIKKQKESNRLAQEEKLQELRAKGLKLWEYKHIRFDYKGRGISQEINLLDIDGERMKGWFTNSGEVPTLPELFAKLGRDGWEMVNHVVNQDNVANGVTWHYYNFKRELL